MFVCVFLQAQIHVVIFDWCCKEEINFSGINLIAIKGFLGECLFNVGLENKFKSVKPQQDKVLRDHKLFISQVHFNTLH